LHQLSDLRLKHTKFDFGWGSTPDPDGGAYSTPPYSLVGFKGTNFRGKEGRKGRAENRTQKGELRRESWREGKKERKGRGHTDFYLD